MKALSDIIQEKREELNITGVTAKRMTPTEANWLQAVEFINNLTSDYIDMFIKAKDKNPLAIKKKRYGGETEMTLIGTFKGFEFHIVVREDENKNINKVVYYLFNNQESKAYDRVIINSL